jgi:thiol-disulfide isomerase/thioredoxin
MKIDKVSVLANLRRSRWVRWLGMLLLVVLMYAGVRLWQGIGVEPYPAPPLAGTLLDGSEYSLERESSKPRLVYFWASWCPICKVQQGAIDALMRDHDVITVASLKSGTVPEVRQYLTQASLNWRVLNDPENELARTWKVRGVPKMYIVDRRGLVRFQISGYTSGIELRARLWFAEHFQAHAFMM